MEEKFCPRCERHCPLDNPGCGRGVAYAKFENGDGERSERGRGNWRGVKFYCNPANKERYDESSTDDKLIFNIKKIERAAHKIVGGQASHSRILMMLEEYDSIPQAKLAEKLGIQSCTMSETITRLERMGLVERIAITTRKHPIMEVTLSEEGAKLAADMREEHEDRISELFDSLSKDERNTLLGLLERVSDEIDRRCEEGE